MSEQGAVRRLTRARSRKRKAATVGSPGDGKGSAEVDAAQTAEERQRKIAEAAYILAEQRGLQPGFELQDWLDAERQFDSTPGISR